MMTSVRRSNSQHLGSEAESHVISLMSRWGAIFHSVGSGNDFGIDGRVELTDQGEVSAEEFFVQIKGVGKVHMDRARDYVQGPPIRVATIIYWLRKLSPTLLLIYERSNKTVYWAWAHEAFPPHSFGELVKSGQETAQLAIPAANLLNKEKWSTIRDEATRLYARVINSVYVDRGRHDGAALCAAASDALDLLIDWLAADSLVAAYPGAMCEEAEQLARLKLTDDQDSDLPPRCAPTNQLMGLVLAWRAMNIYLYMVDQSADASRDGPLYGITKVTAEVLREQYLKMYRDEDDGIRRGAEVGLYGHPDHSDKLVVLSASRRNMAEGFATSAVILRDYVRSLRSLLFGSRPADDDDFADPFSSLQVVSQKAVMLAPMWGRRKDRNNKG